MGEGFLPLGTSTFLYGVRRLEYTPLRFAEEIGGLDNSRGISGLCAAVSRGRG